MPPFLIRRTLSVLALWASLVQVTGASSLQEQADFLAGIPLPEQSVLGHLQQSPGYGRHARKLGDQWAFCRSVRYEAMQQWGRDHLSRYLPSGSVLRYLFGGPDFLNAYAFFPNSKIMVLGGLEPVGEVPPPESLPPDAMDAALKSLDEALHTSLFCGYFITSEMKPQLARGSFQGVLPVLYTELALTGNQLLSAETCRPFGSPGTKITYRRPGGTVQTVYYFQADLSNGKECGRFLGWLGDLGPGASYLKAASYLLPLASFSETRSFLLRSSELILQDDSGIPFRDFSPDEWDIRLYGSYTDPLPIFKLARDPQLNAAYRSGNYAGSLPFGTGYHVNASSANLLLATKHGIPTTRSANAPVAATSYDPAAPTPTPTTVRIRKALPVPVRKALPVPIRKAIPVGTPSRPAIIPTSPPEAQSPLAATGIPIP